MAAVVFQGLFIITIKLFLWMWIYEKNVSLFHNLHSGRKTWRLDTAGIEV